jgi:hypothetical protein
MMLYLPEPGKYLEPEKLKVDSFADRFFDAFVAGERAIDFLNLRVQQHQAAVGSS